MSSTVAPKLNYIETTETSISVEFRPNTPTMIYILQWKQHNETWDTAKQLELAAGVTKAEAFDLQPGTTYCIRLACKDNIENVGPELILDTEQVGCTPKTNKSCCTVQ